MARQKTSLGKQRKHEDADQVSRQAIEIDPEFVAETEKRLENLLDAQRKYEDAVQAFYLPIKIYSDDRKVQYCHKLLENMQRKYDAIEPLYRRIFGEGHPKTVASYSSVSYILHDQEKYDEFTAVEAFRNDHHVFSGQHITVTVVDTINEPSLDIATQKRILSTRYPYVAERQEELPKNKLDKARGKLKNVLEEVASIPFPERKEIIREHLNELEQLKGEAAPPLPDPDLSGDTYPLYVKRTDPFEHLKEVWGPWLVRYTPSLKQDYLDQKQLRERDPVLFKALSNRLGRTKEEHIRDYIPPYSTPFPS